MFEISGPISWGVEDANAESLFRKQGGHYNIYRTKEGRGWAHLQQIGIEPDEMNFFLFSTSGVHGTYTTLETAEEELKADPDCAPLVTFLLVQPRIVSMTYGNVEVTRDNIEHLKALRQKSWDAVKGIGRAE